MTGLIYKATNTKTNQVYVGQTTYTLHKRKISHLSDARCKKTSMHFHRSLNKYGEDAFEWEILEDNIPKDRLDQKEIEYIAKEDSFRNGYNLSSGGSSNKGWKASPETILNMKKSQKGKSFTDETKKKMSLAQKGIKSIKFSPWYIRLPSGTIQYYFKTTIKEYAEQNSIIYTSVVGRFKRIPVRGRFKDHIFGFIKDLKWAKHPPKNFVSLTLTSS